MVRFVRYLRSTKCIHAAIDSCMPMEGVNGIRLTLVWGALLVLFPGRVYTYNMIATLTEVGYNMIVAVDCETISQYVAVLPKTDACFVVVSFCARG